MVLKRTQGLCLYHHFDGGFQSNHSVLFELVKIQRFETAVCFQQLYLLCIIYIKQNKKAIVK